MVHKPVWSRFAVFACIAAVLAVSVPASAVSVDPNDAVMIAYELPPAAEQLFSRTDGKISDFWKVWEDKNLDYAELLPETHETWHEGGLREGFAAGNDDARMKVMFAWGDKGIYALFDVHDDDFVGYVLTSGLTEYHGTPGDRWAEENNDAVELRLCQNSSEELKNNTDELFPIDPATGNPPNGNPYSMAKYGIRFGGDTPDEDIEIFRRNPSYDPNSADSTDWMSSLEYLWTRLGIEDEAPKKGIDVEVINSEATRRIQEWRIAWNQVGMEGAFTKPNPGKMIASYFGYYDVDEGYAGERCDFMHWQIHLSHFFYPHGMNAWGDIQFGGKLPWEHGATRLEGVSPSMRGNTIGAGLATLRCTPTGRILRGRTRPVNGIVIERRVGGTGRRIVR